MPRGVGLASESLMVNERRRNFIVGITTLAAVLGLVFLLLVFGYVPRLLQSGYAVTLELPQAASLNPGSRVELVGIDIGEVKHIAFRQPLGRGVTIELQIRDGVRIPVDAQPKVDIPLLGGSPTIKFNVADLDSTPDAYLSTDGNAVIRGGPDAANGALGDFSAIAANFATLSAEWQAVGDRLNEMLAPQDLQAVEAGEVPGNVTTTIVRMDKRLTEMRELLASAGSFINDPQLREDVTATAANARQATEHAREVGASLTDSMARLEDRYVRLAEEAAVAVGEMNTFLRTAQQGEGTIGKVLNDPALYDNFDDAAQRIGAAADELQLLIEKWKAEGVPVNL